MKKIKELLSKLNKSEKFFVTMAFVVWGLFVLEVIIGIVKNDQSLLAHSSSSIFMGMWCIEVAHRQNAVRKYEELKEQKR